MAKKLNEFMLLNQNCDVFLNCFEELGLFNRFERLKFIGRRANKDAFRAELNKAGFEFSVYELKTDTEKRVVVSFLKKALTDRWGWFSKQYPKATSLWLHSEELTRWYLLNRTCDLVYFGEHIASQTFPQPTFSGAKELVSSLVSLLKDTEARLVEAKQRDKDEKQRVAEANKRQEIETECSEKIAKISYTPPDTLAARVLNADEIAKLKEACRKERLQSEK